LTETHVHVFAQNCALIRERQFQTQMVIAALTVVSDKSGVPLETASVCRMAEAQYHHARAEEIATPGGRKLRT
jgi:hypothetical protein